MTKAEVLMELALLVARLERDSEVDDEAMAKAGVTYGVRMERHKLADLAKLRNKRPLEALHYAIRYVGREPE